MNKKEIRQIKQKVDGMCGSNPYIKNCFLIKYEGEEYTDLERKAIAWEEKHNPGSVNGFRIIFENEDPEEVRKRNRRKPDDFEGIFYG